jgi:hypothetical protein
MHYFREMWWHTSVTLSLRRLRKEDYEFEGSIGYIASWRLAWTICIIRPCLKQTKK